MDYETGVLIAFLLWIFYAVMIIVHVNSQLERNMRKVGLRQSWLNFAPKPLSAEAQRRPFWKNAAKYIFLTGFALPWILLSWLYVIGALGTFLWRWSKARGMPQVVREYTWKLRNLDMDFDQILRESMTVNGRDLAEFPQFKAETVADLQERGLR